MTTHVIFGKIKYNNALKKGKRSIKHEIIYHFD